MRFIPQLSNGAREEGAGLWRWWAAVVNEREIVVRKDFINGPEEVGVAHLHP